MKKIDPRTLNKLEVKIDESTNLDNFINSCVNGDLLLDEIDNSIDEWHKHTGDVELYEYLGMSRQEYGAWVTNPGVLPYIVTARVQCRSLDDVLGDSHSGVYVCSGIDN